MNSNVTGEGAEEAAEVKKTSRAEARPVPCPIYFKLIVPYYPHSHIIGFITTDNVIKIHLINVPSKTKTSLS